MHISVGEIGPVWKCESHLDENTCLRNMGSSHLLLSSISLPLFPPSPGNENKRTTTSATSSSETATTATTGASLFYFLRQFFFNFESKKNYYVQFNNQINRYFKARDLWASPKVIVLLSLLCNRTINLSIERMLLRDLNESKGSANPKNS